MSDLRFQTARLWKRSLAANINVNAYAGRVAQLAAPPAASCIKLVDMAGQEIAGRVALMFIGLGANNDTAKVRIWAWHLVGELSVDGLAAAPGRGLWVPRPIADLTMTFSAFVGVAGSPVLDTERFADTIAITREPTTTANTTRDGSIDLYSPADDTPAWVELRSQGAQFLDLELAQTLNTPTLNALHAFMAENH